MARPDAFPAETGSSSISRDTTVEPKCAVSKLSMHHQGRLRRRTVAVHRACGLRPVPADRHGALRHSRHVRYRAVSPPRRVGEAQRRLRDHPGHVEHLRIQAFATTLLEVYCPNYSEINDIFEQVSMNPDVAIVLSGSLQGHMPGTDDVISCITRHLHNYVASAMTQVDHSRRSTEGRTGPIADEYEHRKVEMLTNPEISFL